MKDGKCAHYVCKIGMGLALIFFLVSCGMRSMTANHATAPAPSYEQEAFVPPPAQAKAVAPDSAAAASAHRAAKKGMAQKSAPSPKPQVPVAPYNSPDNAFNTEAYDKVEENPFLETAGNPLSTFSIDVDTASYANVRRFLRSGSMPYADAVRIEEMVNYFKYDYPGPTGEVPFSVISELTDCPWNKGHKLLHVAVQGKKVSLDKLPPNNLVFLIDVSGSMEEPNRLPLIVSSLKLLVNEMREQDHVAIVVYAGRAGLVLPPTSGKEKRKIVEVLDSLYAEGSTAGGQGIKTAYEVAKQYFDPKANNRVILATDGDFNVGASSDAELERLIEEKRNEGIFLTVLGVGTGNYKDSKMMKLADKGNGNYAYLDSLLEARKVLITEMGGTLLTIAKDVKIQVEFNPASVKSYRLIGYEKRVMRTEDFNNDKKDAGELGSGHTVTALYEIVPAEGKSPQTSEMRYQKTEIKEEAFKGNELALIKLRFKKPNEDTSSLVTQVIANEQVSFDKASENLRFAASVAEWGLILRNSEYKGEAALEQVLSLARGAKGEDAAGYRAEFIQLVETSALLLKGKN